MGKVNDWVIEMQQDALCMDREEWMKKHGESVVEVYDDYKRWGDFDEPSPPEPEGLA